MIDCISVENMRQSDAYTIENFVPSLVLMDRAAQGVYEAVLRFRPNGWQGKTAIVAGSGNNGGDGFALACILQREGHDCTVYVLSNKRSGDSAFYAARAETLGIHALDYTENCLTGYDILVDCLLGTGFHGTPRPDYVSAIHAINESNAFAVSIDINSGMNGDTGEGECIVESDLTVTIGYVKRGLVTENAGEHIKKLVCADIGIHLLREENKITQDTCPQWLDMDRIRAF